MNVPLHYTQDVVNWRPCVPGRIMPDVKLRCVRRPGDPSGEDVGILFLGFGEDEASGAQGVDALAERDIWGVATSLPFGALSPESADQERIVREVPPFLANYYGRGVQPVDVYANSLGGLVALGVVEAPDEFRSVRMMAPFPLVNESLGVVPLLGSREWARRAEVAYRLGVLTPFQLVRDAFNRDLWGVGSKAIGELRSYGDGRNAITDHGFDPAIGRRVADSVVRLMVTHGLVAAFGDADQLVRHREGRSALLRAAHRNGVTGSLLDERILLVRGPHAPLCTTVGLRQFTDMLDYQLPASDAPAAPAPKGRNKPLAA